ncbi:MAG: MraY family glycosyltransferase [Candidatus Komeilibacteria bacterium]
MWWIKIIALFLASGIVGWLCTWLVRRLAIVGKVLDIPDDSRRIHQQPIPLLGGWALYLTTLIMTLWLYAMGQVNDPKVSLNLLLGFFISGAILMLGGWLDDKWRLNSYQSLAFPLTAVIIVIFSGLKMPFITNPFGGLLYFQQWESLILGGLISFTGLLMFLWLMTTIYTVKLLDGLDGLASSISLVAMLVIFVVSLFWDAPHSLTSYLSIIIAGALIGFLLWNWYPAKIFLGESGSTWLGFVLGFLAIVTGGKIATALLVMGIPLLDVIWVIARRLIQRKNIMIGDAGHLHFRLLALGWSQRRVVITLAIVSLLFGSVSFFTTTGGKITALAVLLLLMIGSVIYLLRHEKEKEHL